MVALTLCEAARSPFDIICGERTCVLAWACVRARSNIEDEPAPAASSARCTPTLLISAISLRGRDCSAEAADAGAASGWEPAERV